MSARLSMLGFPLVESIRCKLFAGLPVAPARRSNPTVAFTKVTQDETRSIGLSIKRKRNRVIEKRLGKSGVALHALDD